MAFEKVQLQNGLQPIFAPAPLLRGVRDTAVPTTVYWANGDITTVGGGALVVIIAGPGDAGGPSTDDALKYMTKTVEPGPNLPINTGQRAKGVVIDIYVEDPAGRKIQYLMVRTDAGLYYILTAAEAVILPNA